jgi:hypothetical protein
MDSAKYFQNGLAELIEIWHTAKGVAMIFRWGGPDFNSIYLYRVSQNWLPRENRHVPTTKETLN